MKYENYSYYKGESKNPFEGKDFGKAFWWELERDAFERGDKKQKRQLSESMVEYIREKMWDGDGQHDISLEVALIRAAELYRLGVWARSYITVGRFSLDMAIKESRMNDNPRQRLIGQCRYYKGEKENPFDEAAERDKDAQNKATLWFYEQYWVNGTLKSYKDGEPEPTLSEYLGEYMNNPNIHDFEENDGIPMSLKALIFNRYRKGAMSDDLEPFKRFYRQYYGK